MGSASACRSRFPVRTRPLPGTPMAGQAMVSTGKHGATTIAHKSWGIFRAP